MEKEFDRYVEMLLSVLPDGREEELLSNPDPEALRPFLDDTQSEALLDPKNERLFGYVCGAALSRLREGKR